MAGESAPSRPSPLVITPEIDAASRRVGEARDRFYAAQERLHAAAHETELAQAEFVVALNEWSALAFGPDKPSTWDETNRRRLARLRAGPKPFKLMDNVTVTIKERW